MELKYADAKKQLLRLPGVGEKVADCTLLFGGNFWKLFQSILGLKKHGEKIQVEWLEYGSEITFCLYAFRKVCRSCSAVFIFCGKVKSFQRLIKN